MRRSNSVRTSPGSIATFERAGISVHSCRSCVPLWETARVLSWSRVRPPQELAHCVRPLRLLVRSDVPTIQGLRLDRLRLVRANADSRVRGHIVERIVEMEIVQD